MELKQAELINEAVGSLPIAKESEVIVNGEQQKRFKAIVVNDEVVSIPSKRYNLIQHNEAFRPIIDGLTMNGRSDYNFRLWNSNTKANLDIFVGRGYDSVMYGFRVVNSFDGKTAVRYSFASSFIKERTIELVGYRQVCSNGMKIRVPLNEAEFTRIEEKLKIEELLNEKLKIIHNGQAGDKLEIVQYITEAVLLLGKPLELMIQKAQSIAVTKDRAKELIKLYVGKRCKDRIMEKFGNEEQTLWGLYNSMTFLASHGEVKESTEKGLIDKSATMLTAELTIKR